MVEPPTHEQFHLKTGKCDPGNIVSRTTPLRCDWSLLNAAIDAMAVWWMFSKMNVRVSGSAGLCLVLIYHSKKRSHRPATGADDRVFGTSGEKTTDETTEERGRRMEEDLL